MRKAVILVSAAAGLALITPEALFINTLQVTPTQLEDDLNRLSHVWPATVF